MTDKLSEKDLKGIFGGREDVHVGPLAEGPGPGVETYNKYGVYSPPNGPPVFLCVLMERDEASGTPDSQLTEDDYVAHSVKQWDFPRSQWVGGHGLMNLISRPSFSFISGDDFMDALFKHKDFVASQSEAAPGEERQP